ncbi:hypothetical protein C8T65DRAFT_737478 [Cerioporus squamosus]|nr:hypothetical protein C8T65DRAFT_737478 [Cerioporus squamosus]
MDSIMGGLVEFDDETQEYKCNVNYRPEPYAPYPFVASHVSSLAPPSDRKASFLDINGNLRKWTQAAGDVPSPLGQEEGHKAEEIVPALSVAYTPASWLSEQDWSEPTLPPTKTTGHGHKGDRGACPGAESGSLVEGGCNACPGAEAAYLAEGTCSVRPGTESAPLEERSEEQENYKGGRSAPRGAESGSLVEGGRSTRPGVESAHLAEGSCSGFPGPESAPLEERRNKGGRGARKRARSAALAEGSRRVRPGTKSAPLEERLQEQVLYGGGRSARRSAKSVSLVGAGRGTRPGVESAYLAEGSCSGLPEPESAPLEERENRGGRSASWGAKSAYLEERIKVAERLEEAARDLRLQSMRSLRDVEMVDEMATTSVTRTSSSISVGPHSILKRSRTDESHPEPDAKRVRWCRSTDAPTKTRESQRLYSPRPPQRWDQRLAHGVAKIKAALADVVVKSQSSHAM